MFKRDTGQEFIFEPLAHEFYSLAVSSLYQKVQAAFHSTDVSTLGLELYHLEKSFSKNPFLGRDISRDLLR